ncbi:hypothetical protein KC678_04800 [Candidatus Dojkabacteria bacterium]|uniref:PEGA domain-containing protein n=1 Tax=Candidatus Dojkabacteria bacterium TaxID=2099670 RepID=A0A955L2B7_9BACT|nr:hypothetical protein [Candidatus Dojkabacteria bacterium]
MKTFIRLVILVLVLVLLGLWSPWLQWNVDIAKIFNVEKPDKISGLEVYSLLGDIQVEIDDIAQEGTASASEDRALIIDAIEPGEKSVTVKRISNVSGAYWEYRDIVTFTEGINTIITLGLGPEEEFSEGTVITATKKTNENYNLKLKSDTTDFNAEIDGVPHAVNSNEFTQSISLDQQHTIKITKEGYETLEFTILPGEQSDRDKLVNYIINVETKLMLQPVQIN